MARVTVYAKLLAVGIIPVLVGGARVMPRSKEGRLRYLPVKRFSMTVADDRRCGLARMKIELPVLLADLESRDETGFFLSLKSRLRS